MKKIIMSVLALVGLGVAGFAQTTPTVKKNDPVKTQVVKKATEAKEEAKKVPEVSKPSVQTPPATTKAVSKAKGEKEKVKSEAGKANPVVAKKPVEEKVTATNKSVSKKDGTPDKRFAANKHLKSDGTKDKRYKENKKG